MADANETTLQRMLAELAPGERREHKRVIEPTGREGRFWRVAKDGRISGASLRWINDQPRPSRDPLQSPFVRMNDLDTPRLVVNTTLSPVGELYNVTTGLYLVAAPIVNCIEILDPSSVEVRKCDLSGDLTEQQFCLVLFTRKLDAIDVSRTDLLLRNEQVLPDRGIFVKHVGFPNGVVFADDCIAADVHCFVDVYSGALLFSTALVSCAREKGMHLFDVQHPTGLSTFPSEL